MMKGIKLGLLGITIALLSLSLEANNVLTLGCAAVGVVLALVGCFIKDK